MNNLSCIRVLLISIFLCSGAFFSKAQDYTEWVYNNWNRDKEKVFELAKEQDRYIFLFAGLQGCPYCGRTSTNFGKPDNPLRPIIDADYTPWAYKSTTNYIQAFEDEYVKQFVIDVIGKGASKFPFLFVINPDYPDKYVKWLAGESLPDSPNSVERLKDLLTVDLLASSTLTWYKNKDQVFKLAKEQNKYIFKLVGKGTSPNSQKLIKQLNLSSLKEILGNNYILWYSSDVSEANFEIEPLAGENEEIIKTLPYIALIYPEEPDYLLEQLWGDQDDDIALEGMLKKYTVSNEKILKNNKVSFSGNELLISNQTNNERIRVYSLSGQNITTFDKNDFSIRIDASDFPKGVLVINSSAGWSAKVLLQ